MWTKRDLQLPQRAPCQILQIMQQKESWLERNRRLSRLPAMQRQRYRAKITIVATIAAYCVIMPTELYLRKVFSFDEGIGGMLVAVSSLIVGIFIGEHKAIKKFGG